jgi:hypothetical protein
MPGMSPLNFVPMAPVSPEEPMYWIIVKQAIFLAVLATATAAFVAIRSGDSVTGLFGLKEMRCVVEAHANR